MNGAQSALMVAVEAGVEVCFANPGTTEMDLVTALESARGIRSVLCLFEGVATGAADGYGRIAGKPALTLLHLGPGFANGIANLHNARRAATPIVNMIGDHPTWHLLADAPLTSDIESLAEPVSKWVRRSETVECLSMDMAEAIGAANGPPSGVASLIIAQDAAWSEAPPSKVQATPVSLGVNEDSVKSAAELLRSQAERGALLLGGHALQPTLKAAARIQAITGCSVWLDTFMARVEQGAGLPGFDTLPYFPEQAIDALSGVTGMVVAGSRSPVAFFGYKNLGPTQLLPDACPCLVLSGLGVDSAPGLLALADELAAPAWQARDFGPRPSEPVGALDPKSLGAAVASVLPEGAIVVNESATSGGSWPPQFHKAAPHDILNLTGGAIGQGIPCAVGTAIAAPDRPVVAMQADGSGMYTLQGLWTLAREQLNVTVVVCANRAYRILRAELHRSGNPEPGPVALSLTDLSSPILDWTKLAEGMGVPAIQATRIEDVVAGLKRGLSEPGPLLIEVLLV